jgi:hypothetical protein
LRQEFTDATYGTTLYRATDATSQGSFGTHIYSQLQAFSDDNRYILLIEDEGYLVRRLNDGALVFDSTASWNAPRWYTANTILHYDSNEDTTIRVQLTNVETGQTSTIYTFPSLYDRVFSNQSFDEISLDGRWMAGAVSRNDGDMVLFSLNLETGQLGAILPVDSSLYQGPCQPDPTWGNVTPDWVGVSSLGNYLMVQWVRDGTERCSGLESFDTETGAFLGRAYDGHQHGDLGLLSDGITEVFVTTALASPEDGNFPALVYHRLPGTSTVQPFDFLRTIPWGDGGHISCQGPPGVCAISSYETGRNFDHEVYLQYLDGSAQHLVKHQSSSCGYWVQPRASISRDGSFVVFASDWAQVIGGNSCGGGNDFGRGEAYIIQVTNTNPPPPHTHSPTTFQLNPQTPSPTPPMVTPQPTSINTPAPTPDVISPVTPTQGSILLQTSLNGAGSINSPQIGIGGLTSLSGNDFVAALHEKGARFREAATGKYIQFPASNIDLNQGSVTFWYKPNYNAGADDVSHMLMLVGDRYSPPQLVLEESDALHFYVVTADWTYHGTQTGWRAPLWTKGEWVQIHALWDNTDATDSLRLYVNGQRVDDDNAPGGWDVAGAEPIFFCSGDTAGSSSCNGILDDLILRNSVIPTANPVPLPTSAPTSKPTAATPTPDQVTPSPTPQVSPQPTPNTTQNPTPEVISPPVSPHPTPNPTSHPDCTRRLFTSQRMLLTSIANAGGNDRYWLETVIHDAKEKLASLSGD